MQLNVLTISKNFFIVCLGCTGLIIFYNVYLSVKNVINIKVIEPNEIPFSIVKINPLKWIFNGNVMQYSSVLWKNKANLQFGVFLAMDIESKDELLCLILIENHLIIEEITILEPVIMVTRARFTDKQWIAKCPLRNYALASTLNDVYIAVVEKRRIERFSPYKNETVNDRLVYFNIAEVIEQKNKASKSIILCGELLRDVDQNRFEKFFGWIYMHKSMGYSKAKIAYVDMNSSYLDHLKQHFGEFIEMVHLPCTLERICSYLNGTDFTNCLDYYKEVFPITCEGKYGYEGTDYHKEVFYMNCIMTSKNYEFLSNFDMDEFVLPHSRPISDSFDDFQMIKTINSSGTGNWNFSQIIFKNFTYDIYKYVKTLINGIESNTSALLFFPIWFLEDFGSLFDRILENKFNYTDLRLNDSSLLDKNYFNQLKQEYPIYKSFFKNLLVAKPNPYLEKWSRFISLRLRSGEKCIYNLKNVYQFGFHIPISTRKNTHVYEVPYEKGFLSHFRSEDIPYTGNNYKKWPVETLKKWAVDKEHMIFLTKLILKF